MWHSRPRLCVGRNTAEGGCATEYSMRSLLIILATMLLLAGGFFAYFWMQPATRIARPEQAAPVAPLTQPISNGQSATQPSIQGGEGAWLKHFDDKTLEL